MHLSSVKATPERAACGQQACVHSALRGIGEKGGAREGAKCAAPCNRGAQHRATEAHC